VLEQLHWLPVCQRIVFKIAGLVHQSLGSAPAYLADECRRVLDVGCHPLQSNYNDSLKLLVLLTHNKLCDEFLGRQSSTVERPSSQTTEAWTDLWLLPSDNLWNLIYLATEALSDYWIYRSYTNKLIYLSIYLLSVLTVLVEVQLVTDANTQTDTWRQQSQHITCDQSLHGENLLHVNKSNQMCREWCHKEYLKSTGSLIFIITRPFSGICTSKIIVANIYITCVFCFFLCQSVCLCLVIIDCFFVIAWKIAV